MKQNFSSLVYVEKINQNICVKRLGNGNFTLLNGSRIVAKDIMDYIVFGDEKMNFIFTKNDSSYSFSLIKVEEEKVEAIFFIKEKNRFKREIEFYCKVGLNGFMVNSNLKFLETNAFNCVKYKDCVEGHIFADIKQFETKDFEITHGIISELKLEGIIIREFDRDPQIIEFI